MECLNDDVIGVLVGYMNFYDLQVFAQLSNRCARIVFDQGSAVVFFPRIINLNVEQLSEKEEKIKFIKLCKNIRFVQLKHTWSRKGLSHH